MTNWINRIASKTGFFLSRFHSVLLTLGVYLILSLFTWGALLWAMSPDRKKASAIAYTVSTGGDPIPITELHQFRLLYAWVLVFRVGTWLVVPVLAAAAIDASYRAFEERRRTAEVRLKERLRTVGQGAQLSGQSLEDFVQAAFDELIRPE